MPWEGHKDISVAKTHNLDVIMRRYQTNSNTEQVTKITVPYCSEVSNHERQEKTEAFSQVEEKI